MTFDEQKNVVDELMVDLVPATATIVPYRQTISARRAMTEKEKFLASANQASLIPLQEEFKVFIKLMDENSFDDPLQFYTVNEKELPIFSAVARRVLAIPPHQQQLKDSLPWAVEFAHLIEQVLLQQMSIF